MDTKGTTLCRTGRILSASAPSVTKTAALENVRAGIRINAVCPGIVDTELQRWGWQLLSTLRGVPYEQVVQESVADIPLGRLETVEDVANLVAFLASSESDYITGQAINISGGSVMQ